MAGELYTFSHALIKGASTYTYLFAKHLTLQRVIIDLSFRPVDNTIAELANGITHFSPEEKTFRVAAQRTLLFLLSRQLSLHSMLISSLREKKPESGVVCCS